MNDALEGKKKEILVILVIVKKKIKINITIESIRICFHYYIPCNTGEINQGEINHIRRIYLKNDWTL